MSETNFVPEGEIRENESIRQELIELGIEANESNLEAARFFKDTPQLPEEFGDKNFKGIIGVISNSEGINIEELGRQMKEASIKKITHAEGGTVWDHVKKTIEVASAMDISEEEKRALKIALLFHDYGKNEAANTDVNKKATDKALGKGELKISMIGHAGLGLEKVREGLEANNISEKDLEEWRQVIENHMLPFAESPDEVKIARFVNSLGADADSILRKITLLIEADQRGTLKAILSPDGKCNVESDYNNFELFAEKIKKNLELMKSAYLIREEITEEELDSSSPEFGKFLEGWKQEMKKTGINVDSFLDNPTGFSEEYAKYNEKRKADEQVSLKLQETLGVNFGKELGNILGKLGIQGKDRGEATKRVREMIGGKIEKEGVGVEITRENIESWALGK